MKRIITLISLAALITGCRLSNPTDFILKRYGEIDYIHLERDGKNVAGYEIGVSWDSSPQGYSSVTSNISGTNNRGSLILNFDNIKTIVDGEVKDGMLLIKYVGRSGQIKTRKFNEIQKSAWNVELKSFTEKALMRQKIIANRTDILNQITQDQNDINNIQPQQSQDQNNLVSINSLISGVDKIYNKLMNLPDLDPLSPVPYSIRRKIATITVEQGSDGLNTMLSNIPQDNSQLHQQESSYISNVIIRLNDASNQTNNQFAVDFCKGGMNALRGDLNSVKQRITTDDSLINQTNSKIDALNEQLKRCNDYLGSLDMSEPNPLF